MKKKNDLLISVFIPTGSRIDSLKRALDSLVNQTYKNFEVIIVDYKSEEKIMDIIDLYKDKLSINLIHQKIKGLSRAANLAFEAAKGDIFIRTDDDVVFSEKWLEAVNETIASDDEIGGVTGPTIIPNEHLKSRDLFYFEQRFKQGNLFFRQIGKIYFNYFLEGDPYKVSHWYKCGAFSLGSNYERSLKEPIHEVNNLEACNYAVRTDLLRKIGGFDLGFLGVGEYHEPDAAYKINNLGYKLVFNPKAMLNHCPSQDGFYHERPSSYTRMLNFIIFYFRHIKIDTIDKFFRFFSYLSFLNLYYFYQFLTRRQINQLGAFFATFTGLSKVIMSKFRSQST